MTYLKRYLEPFRLSPEPLPPLEAYWSFDNWTHVQARGYKLAWTQCRYGDKIFVKEMAIGTVNSHDTSWRTRTIEPPVVRWVNDWLDGIFHNCKLFRDWGWKVCLEYEHSKLKAVFRMSRTFSRYKTRDPIVIAALVDWVRGEEAGPVVDYLMDHDELSHLFL
jgi:hypothetical protein